MRISTLMYTFNQGFKNIFRNKVFSLASIATISSCIFLFGLFYAVIVNFQYIVREAQSGVAITVFFDEGITDEKIKEIGEEIKSREEVSQVNYISADEAWESFKEEYLGEYADGFENDNPLEDASNYEIYMKDVSRQSTLVQYLESLEGVRTVNRSDITADALSNVNILIGYVSGGIIFILLAVSIFLISNTVTIGISVRKEEISIMKLIGAKDFVVRAPFVIEGIIIGIIGSTLPLIAVYYIYNNVIAYATEKFTVLSDILRFLSVEEVFSTLIPISIAMGVGIGFFGSFSTVRKHLRV
jgi:cell division transport system permease protein